MKKRLVLFLGAALGMVLMFIVPGKADNERKTFRAKLTGFQEAPNAISTTAVGEFRARLSQDGGSLDFELVFQDLQADSLFSHVHLGPIHQAGGIMFFLCGGGSKPACPLRGGTVTGTVTPSDVIGPTGQGVSAGEFAEAIQAMRSDAAYVNVHSTLFPAGEIRGQINDPGRDGDNQGK